MKPDTLLLPIVLLALCGVPAAALPTHDDRPMVEMRLSAMRFGRPPLKYLSFDVTLRNLQSEPRWFLLPDNLSDHAPTDRKSSVYGVEVFAPEGQGRVTIGRFRGTGSFQALLLPPSAEIKLHSLPIEFWGEPAGSITLEVVIARGFTVGSEPARKWFDSDPVCDVRADVSEDPGRRTILLSSRKMPEYKEVPVVLEGEITVKVQTSDSRR